MATGSLFLILSLTVAANEQLLDAFSYPSDDAAKQAWVASSGTPPVRMAREDQRDVLEFAVPFATQPDLPRTILDRKVSLDLSAVGGFELELAANDPKAVGHVNLYFHSGGGWYTGSGGLAKAGGQTIHFSKAAFHAEDQPAGWQHVDTIRISIWRGQARDATVRLRRLSAVWHDVAIVIPTAAKQARGEHRTALQAAETVGKFLRELGLGSDAIEDVAAVQGALKNRRVAILTYHPRLDEATLGALEQFVERGGKLLVCYTLPARLAQAVGFGKPKHVAAERPGRFAEMRFDAADIAGLPKSVKQASWNITAAEPTGRGARVIGRWFDGDGQPTELPAMLISERGAFLSHIFLNDDPAGKRRLLAAVLGHLEPALWKQMAEAAAQRALEIGHCQSLEQLTEFVAQSRNPGAKELLLTAQQKLSTVDALARQKKYAEASDAACAARETAAQAYLRAQPSPAREGRAFWNHSGTGAYPGDWERSARELAAAGFNMVLPNMLWGGLAHYPSDVLPRSATFKEHGDQIAQCVAAAKKHGLEVHVWKVNYNLSNAPREFVERLRRDKRTQVSHTGQPHDWLCPSHPENFQLELDSMLEVARKYDVDGLHFDYIRYPDGSHCYCDGCRERFEATHGQRVAQWPRDVSSGPQRAAYRMWRCEQITKLVQAVSRDAKQIRRQIKVSAAVFGAYPDCRESVGQDWVSWVQAGYLDFVCPMDYATSDLQFANLVSNQLQLVGGRIPVYPGIGAWQLSSVDRVVGQIYHARQLGAAGFTVFNLDAGAAQSVCPALTLGAGACKAVPPHK
jgi:uncharacterized lipoprotein YddW (UPF0748 family)